MAGFLAAELEEAGRLPLLELHRVEPVPEVDARYDKQNRTWQKKELRLVRERRVARDVIRFAFDLEHHALAILAEELRVAQNGNVGRHRRKRPPGYLLVCGVVAVNGEIHAAVESPLRRHDAGEGPDQNARPSGASFLYVPSMEAAKLPAQK